MKAGPQRSAGPGPAPIVLGIIVAVVTAIVAAPGGGAAAAADTTKYELGLAPGEQRVLPGEGVDQLSTSTKGVVDVRITEDQKQIIVVAAAPGSATLLILMRNGSRIEYSITVSRIRPRRNVRLDVYVVQVERHRGLQLGILWPGNLSATGNLNAMIDQQGVYTGTLNILSTVIPRIDFARNKGWAKVMDQASVVSANGQEGHYGNGGELYFKVATGFAAELRKVEFGTLISAKLAYDDVSGRIEGHVKADVSKIVSTTSDGVPQLSKVMIETDVNLELGQSVALAGLLSDNEKYDMNGFPLLSEIPIIGYFFGSHGTSKEHLENVIFIVPTLVGAVSLEQRDRVSEAFRLMREYDGDSDRKRDLNDLGKDVSIRPPVGRRDPNFAEPDSSRLPPKPNGHKTRGESP